MTSRFRAALIGTVTTGLFFTGTAAVVAKSPEERRQIQTADRVAEQFDAALRRHVSTAADAVQQQHDADQDGYPALLKVASKGVSTAPRISTEGTTAYGREHSSKYATAGARRAATLAALDGLEKYLRLKAIPDSKFIAAGKKLAGLQPGKLLGDTPIFSGAPLRELVLPAFRKARTRLKKQPVPRGADLLRLDLTTYADDAVAMTEKGADKIDEGQPFFFRLGDRPAALMRRLTEYEAGIQAQTQKQVESVVAAP
ncbi:hypothetical protein [Aeromicrobium sp.]|uniref:hypothetical protein n=1 Tax=Aeromicrobium sp. TaxID=1871063 RepID=UPI003C57EC10